MEIQRLIKMLTLMVIICTSCLVQVLSQDLKSNDLRKRVSKDWGSEEKLETQKLSAAERHAIRRAERLPKPSEVIRVEAIEAEDPSRGFKSAGKPIYHTMEELEQRYESANAKYLNLKFHSTGSEQELAELDKIATLLSRLAILINELETCH